MAGLISDQVLYAVAVAEKASMGIKLVARGRPGHASVPHGNQAPDRLVRALSRLQRWQPPARPTEAVAELLRRMAPTRPRTQAWFMRRAEQPLVWSLLKSALARDPFLAAMTRTTVSLTILQAGTKSNVIPAQSEAVLDIRLLPGQQPESVLAELRQLIDDDQVTVEPFETPTVHAPTPFDTPFFRALADTVQALGPAGIVTPLLSPGATDSRYFRQAGMKSYGFVPVIADNDELSRIHGIDERLSTANLRWGTQVVYETIRRFCGG